MSKRIWPNINFLPNLHRAMRQSCAMIEQWKWDNHVLWSANESATSQSKGKQIKHMVVC